VKGSSEPPERRPVTEEDRRQALEGMEEAKRAIAEAMKRPPVEIWSPGKFTEPLGMYEDGSFQPPLTEAQKAHNEEVRRRAREEVRQAREARKDIGTRVSMPGRSQVLSAARQDRIAGVLPGAACGDALGVPYEFQVPLSSDESPRMCGGGLGPYEPGEYSDDTQMAVCIAQVTATGADLREESALDAVAENFLDWAARGATDIGAQTRGVLSSARDDAGSRPAAALRRAARLLHERTGRTAGNGSLMRTGVIALAYLDDPEAMAEAARSVSDLTHRDPLAGDACVLWCEAIRHAVLHDNGPGTGPAAGLGLLPAAHRDRWAGWITEAVQQPPGSFSPNGFVVPALQAAWSAITHTLPADDGSVHLVRSLEAAVRVGDDTDTVAAIAGALVGAYWGLESIPAEWLASVHGWPGLRSSDLAGLCTRTAAI
jgi:ADP-ribosylglycohydrolase